MKVVGVIPSRWGSTRFPGKSLAMLCGKPLIQWVYERGSRAERLDSLIVATDDERIWAVVEGFGGRVVMTGSNHPSGTDRTAEAVAGLGADIVLNIQGDEPSINPCLIDDIASLMIAEPEWDMATAAAPIEMESDLRNPSVVKVVCGDRDRALYFSRAPIPFNRDGDDIKDSVLHWRHVGIYGYRGAFLQRLVGAPQCMLERVEKLEQLRALHIGGVIKVLRTLECGIGVDEPGDIARAEAALRQMSAVG